MRDRDVKTSFGMTPAQNVDETKWWKTCKTRLQFVTNAAEEKKQDLKNYSTKEPPSFRQDLKLATIAWNDKTKSRSGNADGKKQENFCRFVTRLAFQDMY